MNVCGVTFGGYLTKILSFKTGNLLNNSKFHLLSEGIVYTTPKVTQTKSLTKMEEEVAKGLQIGRYVQFSCPTLAM